MSVVPSEVRADQLLGGRYQMVRRIATGGMGQVWEAFDTLLHRSVAVKVLREDLVDEPGFLDRFRDEARHTAGLSHPGIATVYDYGEERSGGRVVAYLVMELVDGEPLSRLLARRGPLPPDEATHYLVQTAHALAAAHDRGVVHRDMKPGNILVQPAGTVKVTDFGVAHVVDTTRVTATGNVVGTATYLSPEQASGAPAGPASDVYALGVVGYEMLTGHPPFTADNPAALARAHVSQAPQPLPSSVPTPLRSTIDASLSKDPQRRPADARAFADRLSGEVTQVIPAVERTAVMPIAATPAVADRPRGRWISWAVAVLLLFGVVTVWAARRANDGIDPQLPATTVVPVPTTTATTVVAPTTTAAATAAAPAPTQPTKPKKKHKGHGND